MFTETTLSLYYFNVYSNQILLVTKEVIESEHDKAENICSDSAKFSDKKTLIKPVLVGT